MSNVVKMTAIISGTINGKSLDEYKASGDYLSFGGYNAKMVVNGQEQDVNFDWISHVANIKNNKIILEAGSATPFGGGAELDDCYSDEYEDAGFSIDDLTAKVLSTIKVFNEFVVYGVFDEKIKHDLKLESVVFSDGQKEYVADINRCEFDYQTD